MKKLLLLFIPLVFFFSCDQNDDSENTSYNCSNDECYSVDGGSGQYATLDDCLSFCGESNDCLLYGTWENIITREYYLSLDNVNIEEDWNNFDTNEIIGARCRCNYWNTDCGDSGQYVGNQSNSCLVWTINEKIISYTDYDYANNTETSYSLDWNGDCFNFDNFVNWDTGGAGCENGGWNCWMKIISVSENQLVIRGFSEDLSDSDFYMEEYVFTRLN